ncbi:hypothetical protein ANK1_3859 [plant metagenome]|uniref:Uncharacterized protein n=1 Tax=plant metagenome TaxID=1297885 RepID=A0A484QGZ0_9ZZZZ
MSEFYRQLVGVIKNFQRYPPSLSEQPNRPPLIFLFCTLQDYSQACLNTSKPGASSEKNTSLISSATGGAPI